MTTLSLSRAGRTLFAAIAAFALLGLAVAEARPGGGGSMGSRGARTWSAPPPTATAPRPATPIERSVTRPDTTPGMAAQRPGMAQPSTGWRPGFGTGFLGGLLGAGLLGMLFGGGFLGGLGGLGSILGLMLQAGLIVGAVMLVMRLLRNRQQPALAGAGAPMARSGLGSGVPGLGATAGTTAARTASAPLGGGKPDTVGIGPADFDAFEASLKAVNAAWDREDLAALRGLATPEMVGYFGEELARNAGRGLHDRVSDVTLLQGDLAEAWREGTTDYATVAMRFSLVNALTERVTGRVVEGDATTPHEATEVWTFRREPGGAWMLSAIQQA
ncbi:Tim44 domain-containing protein [Alsobacter sp. R-9]